MHIALYASYSKLKYREKVAQLSGSTKHKAQLVVLDLQLKREEKYKETFKIRKALQQIAFAILSTFFIED